MDFFLAQWKVCNVSWVLACVVNYCPGLIELSVAGWSRITPEQLYDLVQGLPKLQRLDLSLTVNFVKVCPFYLYFFCHRVTFSCQSWVIIFDSVIFLFVHINLHLIQFSYLFIKQRCGVLHFQLICSFFYVTLLCFLS